MIEYVTINPETLHCLDARASATAMMHWPLPRPLQQRILALLAGRGNCVFQGEEVATLANAFKVHWFVSVFDPDKVLDKVDLEILISACRKSVPEAQLRMESDGAQVRFALHDGWQFHRDGSPYPPCCDPRHAFGYGDWFLVKGKLLREIVCSRCNRLWDVSAA